jgi:hypothetical protein
MEMRLQGAFGEYLAFGMVIEWPFGRWKVAGPYPSLWRNELLFDVPIFSGLVVMEAKRWRSRMQVILAQLSKLVGDVFGVCVILVVGGYTSVCGLGVDGKHAVWLSGDDV